MRPPTPLAPPAPLSDPAPPAPAPAPAAPFLDAAGAFLIGRSFTGYGRALLRLGRGGGTCSPVPFFCTFRKYFCACERIWITVFVPTKLPIFFQSRSYSCSAFRNFPCSSGVQLSRCFVIV